MKKVIAILLACHVLHLFGAALDEISSSRSLITSTASHHDTVTDFITTMNTPELLSWLEQRQCAGRTLPKSERVRIRAGLGKCLFDHRGHGSMPHVAYADILNPIEQFQHFDLRSRSLLEAIHSQISSDRKALITLASVKQKLATKDIVQSEDALPRFSRFGASDLKRYLEDRDALPETSVACIEERIATLEKESRRSIQRHEEYKSEVKAIESILDDFARSDLRENHVPLLITCFPFMACRYACNPDCD